MNKFNNTYKYKMKYFESYILNGTNHRKLTYEEIYDMMIISKQKNIINESVYNKEDFLLLFNFIKNNSNEIIPKNRSELLDFFPIKSRPFKIISHSLSQYPNNNVYNIIFVNSNLLNKDNLQQIIYKICENKKEINIDKLYEEILISDALFMPSNNKSIENKFKHSILWLDKNNLTLEYFFHEFIHYLEWIDNKFYLNANIENKFYFANIDIMNKFCEIFNLTSSELEYIFSQNEYQTLLNDFLNLAEQLKNEYFNEMTGNQFARYLIFNLIKDNNKETDLTYLTKVQNFKYFNKLNSNFSLAMIVGYNLLNFKIMNIKSHIFGKFH